MRHLTQILASLGQSLVFLASTDAGAADTNVPITSIVAISPNTVQPVLPTPIVSYLGFYITLVNNPQDLVHTGVIDQFFVTDYIINAKTTIASADDTLKSPFAICTLYAITSGKVVTIDRAVVDVPVSLGDSGTIDVQPGVTVALQGALCPKTATVRDVAISCSSPIKSASLQGGGNPIYAYNTVLTLLPFITPESSIDYREQPLGASNGTSSFSSCTSGLVLGGE